MSIRNNKARADRLAAEVAAERRARKEHLARARDIFGRRLSSPAGLAACFGAGAVAGLRKGRPEPGPAHGGGDGEDGEEEGFLQRMGDSTIGNIVIRLAAATLVRYMLTSSGHGDDAGTETGTAAGSGPEDMAAAP